MSEAITSVTEGNYEPRELSQEELGRLRLLAENKTFLSDFGAFVALDFIDYSYGGGESWAQVSVEDKVRQSAHLGAHYTALFAWATQTDSWPDDIHPASFYYDMMERWLESGLSWELPDETSAMVYLGLKEVENG